MHLRLERVRAFDSPQGSILMKRLPASAATRERLAALFEGAAGDAPGRGLSEHGQVASVWELLVWDSRELADPPIHGAQSGAGTRKPPSHAFPNRINPEGNYPAESAPVATGAKLGRPPGGQKLLS